MLSLCLFILFNKLSTLPPVFCPMYVPSPLCYVLLPKTLCRLSPQILQSHASLPTPLPACLPCPSLFLICKEGNCCGKGKSSLSHPGFNASHKSTAPYAAWKEETIIPEAAKLQSIWIFPKTKQQIYNYKKHRPHQGQHDIVCKQVWE